MYKPETKTCRDGTNGHKMECMLINDVNRAKECRKSRQCTILLEMDLGTCSAPLWYLEPDMFAGM